MTPKVPPGRAGRLWLRRRLATLRRGLTVLDRKRRILRLERDRLADVAARTGADWEAACREADAWLLRASLLAGHRAIRLAAGGPLAEARVEWVDSMGTSRPGRAVLRPPEPEAPPPLPGTAALVPARDACLAALRAAVEHAAAAEAARILTEEEAMTGRRIRALRDLLLPRLEAELAAVELALDELERSDDARVRRALPPRDRA
ncbi:V-type ATP synthase subunit D [Streptosporangium sandarakinum]|uniref:V/A-type H+-transporting ATPase subunit D n=1 Tax=Streptosporangium sandarakinum TaxID=1260955 RepID=A0A852V084_9ACTN|nr:V-type ATP synthase subunit D [Streptosporangium sandarakinum]NYF41098.1 V/A-type H+-transporting ATPase subunit D [Streptosporangium sandarakinum]